MSIVMLPSLKLCLMVWIIVGGTGFRYVEVELNCARSFNLLNMDISFSTANPLHEVFYEARDTVMRDWGFFFVILLY